MGKRMLIMVAALTALTACSSSASSTSSFNPYPYANQDTCRVFANGDMPAEVEDWSQGTGYDDYDGPASSRLQALTAKWDNDSVFSSDDATIGKDASAIAAWCIAHGYPVAVPSGE
jgi:hypothetical protein